MKLQALPQPITGTKEQYAKVIGRYLQNLTQILSGELVGLTKGEGFALRLRKLLETRHQMAPNVLAGEVSAWLHGMAHPRPMRVELQLEHAIDVVRWLSADRAAPKLHHFPDENTAQPRRRARAPIKIRCSLEEDEYGRLHHIFGVAQRQSRCTSGAEKTREGILNDGIHNRRIAAADAVSPLGSFAHAQAAEKRRV